MCWGGRARLGDDVRYGLDVLSAQPSPAHRSPTRRARRWGVGPGSAGGGGAGGRTARRWPPGVHCTHCTHCSDNCSVFTVHLWWRHRPRDERPRRCCTTLPPSEKKTQKMIIWHHRHDYRRRPHGEKRKPRYSSIHKQYNASQRLCRIGYNGLQWESETRCPGRLFPASLHRHVIVIHLDILILSLQSNDNCNCPAVRLRTEPVLNVFSYFF